MQSNTAKFDSTFTPSKKLPFSDSIHYKQQSDKKISDNGHFKIKDEAKNRHVRFAEKYDFGKNDFKSCNDSASKIKIDKDKLIQKILQNNANNTDRAEQQNISLPSKQKPSDDFRSVQIPKHALDELKMELKKVQVENRELKRSAV